MPPVSEKQRRAMYAAAAGKSTIGIPKKVGKEFVGSSPVRSQVSSRPNPANLQNAIASQITRKKR